MTDQSDDSRSPPTFVLRDRSQAPPLTPRTHVSVGTQTSESYGSDTLFPLTPTQPLRARASQTPLSGKLLTPDARLKIRELKRKASDISDSNDLSDVPNLLSWKEITIVLEIKALKIGRADLIELTKRLRDVEEMRKVRDEIRLYDIEISIAEKERVTLGLNKQPVREDLIDVAYLGNQFVEDVYRTWLGASAEGRKELKRAKLGAEDNLRKKIGPYLDTDKFLGGNKFTYCNVLGKNLPSEHVRCAHIVPRIFCESRAIEYLFGTEENPGSSRRNGLFLTKKIETAWDDGKLAIIPDGSIDQNPIEYKIVLIDPRAADEEVYTTADNEKTYMKDIDGRRLTWQNERRPARRYLYFRYVMAYLKCLKNEWPRDKFPTGQTWATPTKNGGYVRKVPFQALIRATGDTPLPPELIKEGTFEDKETELSLLNDATQQALEDSLKAHDAGEEDMLKIQEDEEEEKAAEDDDVFR